MKILDNIEKYLSFIDDKKELYLEKFKKVDFVSASKLFILNNTESMLTEILFINTRNNSIKLYSFVKTEKIKIFFYNIKKLKNTLVKEADFTKNEISNIAISLDKANDTILNNILDNLLKEVIEHEFEPKRILNDNDSEYVYIFSRMNEKQKEKLAFVIDEFYMKVDEIISDFKKFNI